MSCRWCKWSKFDRKSVCVNPDCTKPAKKMVLKSRTLPISVFTKHGLHALNSRGR